MGRIENEGVEEIGRIEGGGREEEEEETGEL